MLACTLSQTTNFRRFQSERVMDDSFKFDGSGRQFSKWVENMVGKEEIACCEQFLSFSHKFSKDLQGLVWERVKLKYVSFTKLHNFAIQVSFIIYLSQFTPMEEIGITDVTVCINI